MSESRHTKGRSPTAPRAVSTASPRPRGSAWSTDRKVTASRPGTGSPSVKCATTGFPGRSSTTRTTSVTPAATASSTTYWITGRSTTGISGLGTTRVAGRIRVPLPAQGITATDTAAVMPARYRTRRSARGNPGTLARMRILVARCTVDYTGRLDAHIPSAIRLIMVKADGCVAVHADGGAYKPLHWINAPNHVDEQPDRWVVTNTRGETLVIHLEEILTELSHELGSDPGLEKDGVEKNLQELLADRAGVIEEGLEILEREYPTDLGPVDLLCRDRNGQVVAVEIKRRGELDGVEQLVRYLDWLNRDATLGPVRGILAATKVTSQARTLAAARGVGWVEVDYDRLRGTEGRAPR